MATNTDRQGAFSHDERKVLHSLAEMFQAKDDRDELRRIVEDGATVRELIMAYRTQRRLVSSLKAAAGLIVVVGGALAVLRSSGLWPK